MSKDGVYLCAEIGVNWAGRTELLFDLAGELAMCNVDAVKLQMFDEDTLNGKEYTKALKKQLTPMILENEDILRVSRILKDSPTHPDLIITPFNLNCVERLSEVSDRIQGIKIRATDWDNIPLIEVAKRFDKPMYVSVPYENGCLKVTKKVPNSHFLSLKGGSMKRIYCVPKYPPEPTDLHLNQVTEHDGISLHSPNWAVHLAAAAMALKFQYDKGIKRRFYIEVHTYPLRNLPIAEMPDFNVSVSPVAMAQLAQTLAELEVGIG